MKIACSTARARQGYALLMVLVFSSLSLMILASAMNWTANTSFQNERNNQFNRSMFAAEAATEKVLARMTTDYKNYGEGHLYSSLNTYRGLVPTSTESSEWTGYSFWDAQNNLNSVYVERTSLKTFTQLGTQFSGLGGFRTSYRIIANARNTAGRFPVTAAVQQEVGFTSIPVFQFAIFYNGLLEFTRAAPMNIRGRVHSNNSMYLGSFASSYINFYGDVTTVGTQMKKDWWDYSVSDYTGPITYHRQKLTNSASMILPIGTNNTSAAVHRVIERPTAGESTSSAMGQQRYYNKAEVLLLVTDNSVTLGVKTPFATTSNNIPASQINYFVNTNAGFYDQREGRNMQITEIDIGKFKTWASTSSICSSVVGGQPNLIYAQDNRTRSGYGQGVRLVNAANLPTRGLTVSSPNGLYVKGTFNCPVAADLGTTNTFNTRPASLVADAVTLQSSAWSDANSNLSYTSRDAASTTVNAAIISGNVESQGADGDNPMSGGAHNLPRLLEDWTSQTLTINGSMVCLFQSTRATGRFIHPGYSGQYYVPPTRNWSFDTNFLDPSKLPPGTPEMKVLERLKWVNPPADTINNTGI